MNKINEVLEKLNPDCRKEKIKMILDIIKIHCDICDECKEETKEEEASKKIDFEDVKKLIEARDKEGLKNLFLRAAKAKEDKEIKKLKQNLHETIDAIETEKDLQYFCWKMGQFVFDHFKEKVIGDDENKFDLCRDCKKHWDGNEIKNDE